MSASLVIMAAGIGSRYGGEKQTDCVGPNGEILMEYSVYDAVKAGFDKIVFIIKPDMLDTVKSCCGDRLEKQKTTDGTPIKVEYVFQDTANVPEFYKIPAERTRPLGTVHAVLCVKDCVDGPFAVLNADDYYGLDALKTMRGELDSLNAEGEAAMVGFLLKNTVSPNGAVTRGICSVESGKLSRVTETYKIKLFPDGSIRDTEKNPDGLPLDPDSIVSMNFWGFTPWIFGEMEKFFHNFLANLATDDIRSECLLPIMVDSLINSGALSVRALQSDSTWFGMTYKEDRESAAMELIRLHNMGLYPASLKL